MARGIRAREYSWIRGNEVTSIDGLPVINTPGKIWFVDGTNGGPTRTGESWAEALSTIQAAINKVTSNKQDVIFVAPGTYSENLTVTSKHAFSIIASQQVGNSKRVVVSAAAGKALDLGQSQRLYIKGLSFYAAASDAVVTDSEGVLFEDCDFRSDGGSGLVFFADTDNDFTGSGTVLYRCLIRECSSATGAILSKKGGPTASDPGYGLQATNVNIWECQFYTNTGPDIADDAGTETPTYFNQWDIRGNKFMTKNKATYLDMDTGNGTDCLISGNFFADAAFELTTAAKLPSAAMIVGNYIVGGTGGIINAV